MGKYTFSELTDSEFDGFVNSEHCISQSSFAQSSKMAKLQRALGKEVYLVGVKLSPVGAEATGVDVAEMDKPEVYESGVIKGESGIVAAACIAGTSAKFGKVFDAQNGFIADFENLELLKFFADSLKTFLRKKGCYVFTMNPYVVYRTLSSDGVPTSPSNDTVVNNLLKAGFFHHGFTIGYGVTPRFMFVKNIDGKNFDDLLKGFAKSKQQNIKKALDSYVKIKKASYDELERFQSITEATSFRRNFADRGLPYFQKFFEAFGDSAQFLIAEFHINEYVNSLEKSLVKQSSEIQKMRKSLDEVPNMRKEKRLKVAESDFYSVGKRLKTAKKFLPDSHNGIIDIASALFVENNHEMVYLFSGTEMKYGKFFGPALLQAYIIKYCVARGIKRYNFYGIDGIFDDPSAEGRGVLEFKQGFNGYAEELIGEFELPIKPAIWRASKMASKVLGRG